MALVDSLISASFLHRGGEACIYKVQGESSKTYSFKWYNRGVSFDEGIIGKLQKQNVPGVYRILESGTVEGRSYIIYDFVEGVPSADLSPMPLALALHSLRKVVSALQALQGAGISHGDINPSNVFFDGAASPVLMDFGIVGPGVLHFSAPERFTGAVPSEKSDLFSLGALLYFWVSGETLLKGETFEEIRDGMSKLSSERIGLGLMDMAESGKIALSPEDLSVLDPLWKGLLQPSPESRLEDLEELDELLEIALEKLGGEGVHLARQQEQLCESISGIIEKNGAKTLENVDLPFLKREKPSKTRKKGFYLALVLFILILVTLASFVVFGGKGSSVDETGALLMQKTRDSQLQSAPDSVNMPDMEGVLERLKPEESE